MRNNATQAARKKLFLKYLKLLGFSLIKGKIDWKLMDGKGNYICTVKIMHGKHAKEEVAAMSVKKLRDECKERGLVWPPRKK